MSATTVEQTAHQQWQAERRAYVTGPHGNLALTSYQPVRREPAAVQGMPALVRLAAEGVFVSAEEHAGVTVDGRPLVGETYVPRLRPDGTPVVAWERLSFDVFSLDGTDFELRMYDEDAEPLSRFERIATWPFDAGRVVSGRFVEYDATREVAWDFTRSSDAGHAKRVPGEIEVEIDGTPYALLAFLDGEVLVLVFADATTGPESYAPGRFLRLPPPAADGTVEIDFNRAFVPPCGFSNSYSCPLPPLQNRIGTPIRAGEQRVVWKTV